MFLEPEAWMLRDRYSPDHWRGHILPAPIHGGEVEGMARHALANWEKQLGQIQRRCESFVACNPSSISALGGEQEREVPVEVQDERQAAPLPAVVRGQPLCDS